MKRRATLWGRILVVLAALGACGGLDTFDIAESSAATIQGASILEQIVGDVGFGGFLNMDISQSEEFKNQGVEKNQIDSVRLKTLTLTITNPPSGQDFTFLESLKFYAEAEGLARTLIATGGPFAAGSSSVGLDVEDVELAPYASAPSMNVTTEATGRRPGQDTTVDAAIVLTVDANVSGAVCGN